MVEGSPFGNPSSVFTDRSVFKPNYTPDNIVEREDEIEEYSDILESVLNENAPDNAILLGKSGTGKTATTNYLLKFLHKEIDDRNIGTNLNTIRINCEVADTSYKVAVEIVNRLRKPTNQMSRTGHPTNEVFTAMRDELMELDGITTIILDEVDRLGTDGRIVYMLTRDQEEDQLNREEDEGHPDWKTNNVSVVGISNSLDYMDNLSSKTKSSFSPETVKFSPYDKHEIKKILKQRADIGLKEGVLPDGTLDYISAISAKYSGDARKAIQLLKKSADLASDDGEITIQHAEEAQSQRSQSRIEDVIETISPHEQYVFEAVTIASMNHNDPVRTTKIYELYAKVCKQYGSEPLSNRSVRDHLSNLDMLSAIESTLQQTGVDGNYKTHELKVSTEAASEYFSESIDEMENEQDLKQQTL